MDKKRTCQVGEIQSWGEGTHGVFVDISQPTGQLLHSPHPKLTLHLPLNELVPDKDNKPTKNKSKF